VPSDNFNRADGALGANWVTAIGSLTISSNQVKSSAAGDNIAYWATPVGADDQYAELTVTGGGTGDYLSIGVGVRLTATGGYIFYGGSNVRVLGKRVGPGVNWIATNFSNSLNVGDVIRLEVIGNKLRPLVNGVLDPVIGEVTDTDWPTGGAVGISGGDNQSVRMGDDWSGGVYVPAYALNAEQRAYAVTGLDATLAGPAIYLISGSGAEVQRTATTNPQTWTHTPAAGPPPDGIVVTVVHGTTSTDHVTGITYGGVPMTRAVTAAHTGTEPGRADIWFLGTGIPPGLQTISATLATATTDDIHFVSNSIYNDEHTDMVVVDSDSQVGILANPSRTLQYGGANALAIGAFYGGGAAPSAFVPNANCLSSTSWDMGNFYSFIFRQRAAGTADFTIGGTAVSDDVALAVAAFGKSGGAAVNALPGSYALTGLAATTARSRFIDSTPGSYALTGPAATLAKAFPIIASPGAYATAGNATAFARSYALTATAGAYSVTGTAATTARGYLISAVPGIYSTAGLAATLARGYLINAAAGAHPFIGIAATTARGRFVDAGLGAYSVTGLDAELSKTAAAEHALAADSGVHLITGAAAALTLGQFITADFSSYTTEGHDATLAKTGVNQYEITADSGSYAVDGLTAALVFAQAGQFILTAAPGLYDLAAPASELLAARQLILLPGSYAAAGLDTGGGIEFYLLAQPGVYVLSGEEPIFELVRRFEPGIYLVSGRAAQLLFTPLQIVGDGWRFTDELLASSVLAASEISNPVFSNEAFRLVAMDGESIRQTGVHSEALQTVKLEVPLQTVGKFTDESLVSPDLVAIQSLIPIFGSEGFSFPDLDDESTRQPGADDKTLEVTELEEEVLT
jgi:hypothetical protein